MRIHRFNFNVWNYGHGGFTTRQIQYYAKKTGEQATAKIAFVMAGINDGDKSINGAEQTFADYKMILETLIENGVTPVIQHTLYRQNEPAPDYIDHLNNLLSAYAGENGLETINLNPILSKNKSLLPLYTTDGTHLTEAAYDVWSQQVREVLRTIGLDA